jgi:hypothetical protein
LRVGTKSPPAMTTLRMRLRVGARNDDDPSDGIADQVRNDEWNGKSFISYWIATGRQSAPRNDDPSDGASHGIAGRARNDAPLERDGGIADQVRNDEGLGRIDEGVGVRAGALGSEAGTTYGEIADQVRNDAPAERDDWTYYRYSGDMFVWGGYLE